MKIASLLFTCLFVSAAGASERSFYKTLCGFVHSKRSELSNIELVSQTPLFGSSKSVPLIVNDIEQQAIVRQYLDIRSELCLVGNVNGLTGQWIFIVENINRPRDL